MASKESIKRKDPGVIRGLSLLHIICEGNTSAVNGYTYIIYYVNQISSRKYRPAATQGGFKMDRTVRIVRGVMAVCMVHL